MTYVCNNCLRTFDADEAETEDFGFFHAFGYHRELRPVCPYCFSDDIDPEDWRNAP